MRRHTVLRGVLAALVLATLHGAAAGKAKAQEIRAGDTRQAKPDAIWFHAADTLARWQELKAGGNAEALAAFEQDELGQRTAWRFTAPLTVKVLGVAPATHQVHVEMETRGRLQGTDWYVDTSALGN